MKNKNNLFMLFVIILSTNASIIFFYYSYSIFGFSPGSTSNSQIITQTGKPDLKTMSSTDYALAGGPPDIYAVVRNNPLVWANYLNFMGVGFETLRGTLNGSSTFSHSSFLSLTDDGNGNTAINTTITSFNDSVDQNFAQACLNDAATSVKCYSDVTVASGNIIGGNQDEYITATSIMENSVQNSPLTTIAVYKWSSVTNIFELFDSFNMTNVFVTSMLTQDILNTGIKQLVVGGYNFNGQVPNIDTDSLSFIGWLSSATTNTYPFCVWVFNYSSDGHSVSTPSQRTVIVNGTTTGNYIFSIGSSIDTGQLEPSLFGNSSSKLVYGNSPTSIIRYSKYGLLSFGPETLDQPAIDNVSIFSFDLISSKFVKNAEFEDKMSRPIFADFNNNGQDILIIPEALWGTNGDYQNPAGPSGFLYAFNPIATGNSVWQRGEKFIYYGPVGAGRLTGFDTDVIAFEGNNFQTSNLVIFSKNNPDLLAGSMISPMATPGDVHDSYYASGKIQTADLNQNGREDIIFPWMLHVNDYSSSCCPDATARNYMSIYALNNSNIIGPSPFVTKPVYVPIPINPFELTSTHYIMNNYCNRLAMGYGNDIAECPSINSKIAFGDFFGWSMVGKYQPPSFTTMGRPKIISVLAAPPMVQYSSQFFGDSDTAFQTTTSSSSANGTSSTTDSGGSVSLGITVTTSSFGATFGFEASAGVNWDSQSSATSTSTMETDISNRWGTDPYNDGVVFSSTLFINYNYTIFEAPAIKFIGLNVVVTLPLHTDVMKTNLDFFQQLYTSSNYNITGRIPYFNHSIGNPTTYPSYNNINQSLIKLNNHNSLVFLTDPNHENTVGQGSWIDSLELQMSQQMSQDQEWSLSSGIQTHAKIYAGYATIENDLHWDSGHGGSITTTIGSSTVFHADVGQFSDQQQWLNYKYNYGLFIYSFHDLVLKQDYLVVNYYTGEFGQLLLQNKLPSNPNQFSPGAILSFLTTPSFLNFASMLSGTISFAYLAKNGLQFIKKIK